MYLLQKFILTGTKIKYYLIMILTDHIISLLDNYLYFILGNDFRLTY